MTRKLKHCPCEFVSRVGFWVEDSKDGERVCAKCNNCHRAGASFAADGDIEAAREQALNYWNGLIDCVSRKAA